MIYATGIKCPYCGYVKDTFDFLRYLYDKENKEINDGITCDKCGKVFYLCFGTKNESNHKKCKN